MDGIGKELNMVRPFGYIVVSPSIISVMVCLNAMAFKVRCNINIRRISGI